MVVNFNVKNVYERLTHFFFGAWNEEKKDLLPFLITKISLNFFQYKLNFRYCQHAIFTYLPEATFFNRHYIHFLIKDCVRY